MSRKRYSYIGAPPPMIPKRTRKIVLGLVCLCIAYVAYTYYEIARQSEADETRNADAIVVFGAAEYAGRPSPVLKARLDHSLELYGKGVAPFVVTTGGNGDDPNFSEGGVGRAYLMAKGVPDSHIIAETQSDDTNESAQRVAAIMRANKMTTCLVVSDGYHIYRIKRMMAEQGVTAYGAPRPGTKELGAFKRSVLYLREVLSITLWRLHIT
jgi:uncharacterized SAM-binding protein YcdF (DUF218 family)